MAELADDAGSGNFLLPGHWKALYLAFLMMVSKFSRKA